MSSLTTAANVPSTDTTTSTTTTTATITNASGGSSSSSSMRATPAIQLAPNLHALAAQFREIHKNTWLKRLTAEGKRITVGPKKSDRSWVVFCVHDDTEAMLEGYAEPRQAAAHCPEWIVSLRHTLHISHALIPNSHEFEFVVALNNEVVRFHAMSWEIMQEWVETLRAKLREMKILSPRENLYTKLPEARVPLLPTRDPTSPLPAPPPVPAALVPGVERVVPHTTPQIVAPASTETNHMPTTPPPQTENLTTTSNSTISTPSTSQNNNNNNNASDTSSIRSAPPTTAFLTATTLGTAKFTSMSNTLTQNLLNMLSDPISAYSEHLSIAETSAAEDTDESNDYEPSVDLARSPLASTSYKSPNASNSVRVDINTNAKSSPGMCIP